ncbi:MAG TPA: hypothetical protein VEU96_15755 [Bryobacteraceae bacterium]|nr:hypothetical protein [Bryobacteraceae bacterium]
MSRFSGATIHSSHLAVPGSVGELEALDVYVFQAVLLGHLLEIGGLAVRGCVFFGQAVVLVARQTESVLIGDGPASAIC